MINSSIRNVVDSGNEVMKYDEHVKNLLSEKAVNEIEKCISDEIVISKVGLLPGLSNQSQCNKKPPTKIRGESVEKCNSRGGKKNF